MIDRQQFKNPSYDKSLPIKTRVLDFLGKYHILYNGVNAHEPFDLKNEGRPGVRCDQDTKYEIADFIDQLLSDQREELIEKVKRDIQYLIHDHESYTSPRRTNCEVCKAYRDCIYMLDETKPARPQEPVEEDQ